MEIQVAITQAGVIYHKDIADALNNTVGYGTGKKISEFASGTPAASDTVLFEQDGVGKSTTVEDLGKAIGINMDNLWTNEGSESPFGSQTVPLDLTEYRYIRIIFKRNVASTDVVFHDCFIGMTTICMLGTNANGYRSVNVTNSSVSFSSYAEYATYNGNDSVVYNQMGVPFVILGVK